MFFLQKLCLRFIRDAIFKQNTYIELTLFLMRDSWKFFYFCFFRDFSLFFFIYRCFFFALINSSHWITSRDNFILSFLSLFFHFHLLFFKNFILVFHFFVNTISCFKLKFISFSQHFLNLKHCDYFFMKINNFSSVWLKTSNRENSNFKKFLIFWKFRKKI